MMPQQLSAVGFRFCKLNGKIPCELDWQNSKNYAHNDPEIIEWKEKGGNIGVVTGYNLLLVLDFDDIDFYHRFKDKLPPTFTVKSGGKGLPHLYYKIRDCDSAPNRKYGKIDIKGLGGQVVAPGSKIKKEDGSIGEYQVINDIQIADISYNTIKELFSLEEPKDNNENKKKDMSRSGREWGELCKKINQGLKKGSLDKDYIFNEMNFFSKWKESPQAYRERSWEQALKHCTEEKEKKDLMRRNTCTNGLKIDNYYDNVEAFYKTQPFFYDKTQLFWWWNTEEYRYERVDDVDLMNMIDEELSFGGQTVTGGIKSNYMEAFRRVGRKHLPMTPPKTWVQFKNKIVDVKTGNTIEASPKYFMCNPIPWNLGTTDECPTIDKLFNDWLPENKQQLYEVLAYCCLPDYPIHTISCLIGTGRNGKTSYNKILEKFIGSQNITSSQLDTLLDNRFESARLFKKLVCTMGETNFNVMSKTDLLKKLSGQDLIGFEFKNKDPFTDHNYAKIIISTNSLPPTTDDTDGFYRRWLIIHFQKDFAEGKDITENIPDEEYEALAFKSMSILKQLLEVGKFTNQGTIEERKQRYILASNPLSLFLRDHCEQIDSFYVKLKDFYHAYVLYLRENKRRVVKRKEFLQLLSEEGLSPEHTKKKVIVDGQIDWENSFWIDGIRISPLSPFSPSSSLHSRAYRKEVENLGKLGKSGKSVEQLVNLLQDSSSLELDVDYILSLGFEEWQLTEWKAQGIIFEPKVGRVRLL